MVFDLSDHPLCRGIRADKLRIRFLQIHQLMKQLIIFKIFDLRRILFIIESAVIQDKVGQLVDLFFGLFFVHFSSSEYSRDRNGRNLFYYSIFCAETK